jgi:hypothetical protein
VVNSAAAAIPVAGAMLWCVSNQMVEGAGGRMDFGFHSISRHAPVVTLFLSLGPALVPAAAGLLVPGPWPRVRLLPAAVLSGVSLFLMYYLRLAVDENWVGFRTGHLLLVSLPAMTARFFASALASSRLLAGLSVVMVLLAGLPTLIVDVYNAQDLRNFALSPSGFPWTRKVTPDEQAAWRWLREATPLESVVQQDALSRHPGTWWVVPTFGHRRMSAAIPPFLIYDDEYMERSKRVRAIYATADAAAAWEVARALHIDYIYLDEVERTTFGASLEKFGDTRYFELVFQNPAVTIYRVK